MRLTKRGSAECGDVYLTFLERARTFPFCEATGESSPDTSELSSSFLAATITKRTKL